MKKAFVIIATVIVLVVATYFADKATRVKATTSVKNADQPITKTLGQPAPEVTFKDLDGTDATLAKYRGKVVLVNFWATWCDPCLAKDRFNANGQKLPMNYPIVIGNDDVADKFGGLLGYPPSFLISKDGKIVKKVQGLISYEELTKASESQL